MQNGKTLSRDDPESCRFSISAPTRARPSSENEVEIGRGNDRCVEEQELELEWSFYPDDMDHSVGEPEIQSGHGSGSEMILDDEVLPRSEVSRI